MIEAVDTLHEHLEERLLSPIERIDRFLGDDRLDDDTDSSRVRLRLGYDYSDLDGLSLNTRVQVRIALPALERRLQIVADNILESEDPDSLRGVAL